MPSPCIEEGQAPAPVLNGTPRAHNTDTKRWTTTHALLVAALPLPHTRDPSCRAPLTYTTSAHTHDHPQACEPRCADVFKHYLACADRIEQKGAGAGAASLNTNRHRTPSPRPHHTQITQEGNSGSSSSNGYESSAASAAPSPLTPARMPTWGLSPPSKRSNRTS